MANELVTQIDPGQLAPYQTANAIRKALPDIADQFDYRNRLEGLHKVIQDRRLKIASIESEAAMAATLDEALKKGDVVTSEEFNGYRLLHCNNVINNNTVNKWRKVQAISQAKRQQYYREFENPSRESLIKWITSQAVRDARAKEGATIRDPGIKVGDFRKIAKKLPDRSIDLIFTDPPWDRKSVALYSDLAAIASRVLVQGGSLMTYGCAAMIPDIISAMANLRFYWVCGDSRETPALYPRSGIRVCFVPILWFVNGTERFDTRNVVRDLIRDEKGRNKTDHDWQQGIDAALYYIEQLTPDDGSVFDPFCGSGTTALAAKTLRRKYLTCDIDKEVAHRARARIKHG